MDVSVVQVKPGMMQEYEALKKEMSDALRKAGSTYVHVWQVARGTTSEYHTATPVKNFAQSAEPSLAAKAMGEEGFAKWVAKITNCIQTRRLTTLRAVPSLSIPAKEGSTRNLAILTTRENLPGVEEITTPGCGRSISLPSRRPGSKDSTFTGQPLGEAGECGPPSVA